MKLALKTVDEVLSQFDLDHQDGRTYSIEATKEAMKEYARLQIKSDRERIKSIFINTAPFGSGICKDIDSVPINLD